MRWLLMLSPGTLWCDRAEVSVSILLTSKLRLREFTQESGTSLWGWVVG